MSAALSLVPSASPLLHLFPPSARRGFFARLAPDEAVRVASEVVLRALNAVAIDPATRIADPRITDDRRFTLALTVAVPLSLQGRVSRPGRLADLGRRLVAAASLRGAAGPAGRMLDAARLLLAGVSDPPSAGVLASRAVDLAIDAEVLAASLQDRDLAHARAVAERRALDICNASAGRGLSRR